MKPFLDSLCVVTATTDLARSKDCIDSWHARAAYDWPFSLILNGRTDGEPHLGVVPAFAQGMTAALATPAQIICCLHDDVLIEEDGWDARIVEWFEQHPACGLAGFGGGRGLGAADIYQVPYDPMQLARQDFISNMRDAEAHGRRVTEATRVRCLDGFSQVGRREYWQHCHVTKLRQLGRSNRLAAPDAPNLFQRLADLGVVHHAYDAALGCYAARMGWQTWMLPVACHHFGGRTAVADQDYHRWAKGQHPDGDQGFWQRAHKLVYEEFRDQLPLHAEHDT